MSEWDSGRGVVIQIPEDYQHYFKGGNRVGHNGRRKSRPPLADGIRPAARRLLNSPVLTPRDEAISETLYGVGLLSRHQIQRLFFPGRSRIAVAERLRELYQRHLVDYTPDLMGRMRTAGLVASHVYKLGLVGQEIVALRRGLNRSGLGLSDRYNLERGNPLLMHDLQVSEVYVQAKVASHQLGGDLIWYNEAAAAVRSPAGEELVRPDGFLRLTWQGISCSYFVEMDRGATHWADKVDFYEEAGRRGQYQHLLGHNDGRLPAVLAIYPGKAGAAAPRVRRAVQQQARHVQFLLKSWPDLLQADFSDGWQDGATGQWVNLLDQEVPNAPSY